MKRLIVGISGVSGGGKSTLATKLFDFLSNQKNVNYFDGYEIKRVELIHQDKYFHRRDSPKHTWIKEINFINRELLSAIDMQQMWEDTQELLHINDKQIDNNSLEIFIIEGFLIYNDDRFNDLCQLRFHLTLTPEECMQRRMLRQHLWKHVNPQPVKYFNEYVWPSYVEHREKVKRKDQIYYLNGEKSRENLYDFTLETMKNYL